MFNLKWQSIESSSTFAFVLILRLCHTSILKYYQKYKNFLDRFVDSIITFEYLQNLSTIFLSV